MNEFSQQIMDIITPAAITAVSLFVTVGLAKLSKWLKSKTDNENAQYAIDDLIGLTRAGYALMRKEFQDAMKDGVITAEEEAKMKAKIKEFVKTQIPPAMEQNIGRVINDLEGFIEARIAREEVKQE